VIQARLSDIKPYEKGDYNNIFNVLL